MSPVPVGHDLLVDTALAIAMQLMRALCGSSWKPLSVSLPRRAPKDVAAYHRFFGLDVVFNARLAHIAFAASWLRARIPHDAALDTRLRDAAVCSDALPTLPLSHLVLRALHPMIHLGTATQPNAARLFGLHPRNFSRQLHAEGTTFLALLNEARMTRAEQLLRDTDLRAGEIASTLHYAEPSAFTKAFRARTGTSPRAWRQRARGESPAD